MIWTDEKMAICRHMWEAGHSGEEIAAYLGEGLTRNAVIGKCQRMKAKWNATGGEPARGKEPTPATTGVPLTPPEPVFTHAPRRVQQPLVIPRLSRTATASNRPSASDIKQPRPRNWVTLLEAKATQCHWVEGEARGADTIFCGSPVHENNVYCAYHCVAAYTYPEVRVRKVARREVASGASA